MLLISERRSVPTLLFSRFSKGKWLYPVHGRSKGNAPLEWDLSTIYTTIHPSLVFFFTWFQLYQCWRPRSGWSYTCHFTCTHSNAGHAFGMGFELWTSLFTPRASNFGLWSWALSFDFSLGFFFFGSGFSFGFGLGSGLDWYTPAQTFTCTWTSQKPATMNLTASKHLPPTEPSLQSLNIKAPGNVNNKL